MSLLNRALALLPVGTWINREISDTKAIAAGIVRQHVIGRHDTDDPDSPNETWHYLSSEQLWDVLSRAGGHARNGATADEAADTVMAELAMQAAAERGTP